MSGSINLFQTRGEFNVGPLHIYAGQQIAPQDIVAVGHKHDQPHLMVLLNPIRETCPHCAGKLPVPKYRVRVEGDDKSEHVKELGPYGLVYVRAGYQHSVEQTEPGALGGFACIFPRYDENGKLMEDPKRQAEPGVIYG